MANYFLHVDILVKDTDSNSFETLVKKICGTNGTFDRNGWKLRLALKSEKTCQYHKAGRDGLLPVRVVDSRTSSQEYRRFVNVWDLPEPFDIAAVMQQLADNSDYATLDNVVVREIQNQIMLIDGLASSIVPSVGDIYVEIQRNVPTASLAEYLFSAGILAPSFTNIGWTDFGSFQFVTGSTDGLVEFWGAPPNASKIDPTMQLKQPNLIRGAAPKRNYDLWDVAENEVAGSSQTAAVSGPIRGARPDNLLKALHKTLSAEWRDQLQVYFTMGGA